MSKSDLLPSLFDFLHCDSKTNLEITFAHLDIYIYHNGRFQRKIERPNSRILLYQPPNGEHVQMDLVDALVFRISFWFKKPTAQQEQLSEDLHLPHPLTEGYLEVDTEKLFFSFTVSSPGCHMETNYVYSQLCGFWRK